MTGMEMMVQALLHASGVDPEKVKSDVAAYAEQLTRKIASMDAALLEIRNDQTATMDAVREVLEAVRRDIYVANKS